MDGVRSAVAGQIDPQDHLSFSVADLLRDDGWNDAVRDCDYVIHVASPMGQGEPKANLVSPAREGTLRVLRAAREPPHARIVVVTCPAILPPSGTCPTLGINDPDAVVMRQAGDMLAEVTRASAKEAAVILVDMAQLSLGHDACAETPWINGAVPAQGAKFHPTMVCASATAEPIRTALHPSS